MTVAGEITHAFFGQQAYSRYLDGECAWIANPAICSNESKIPGLRYFGTPVGIPNTKLYECAFWHAEENTNKVLLIRRGVEWADTPVVWALSHLSYSGSFPDATLSIHADTKTVPSHMAVVDL